MIRNVTKQRFELRKEAIRVTARASKLEPKQE